MIALSKKLAGFFLRFVNNSTEVTTLKERYKQFRINLLIVITLIALFPSSLLAVLGYFQYLHLAQQQSAKHIRWHLEYVKDSLTNHLEKLTSNLFSTVNQSLPMYFESEKERDQLLIKMQANVEGITGIELIRLRKEEDKVSVSSLPRQHLDSNKIWFITALSSAIGMSPMMFDKKGSAFFIIALHPTIPQLETDIIVKVTISRTYIENLIKKINADAVEDVFFIATDGLLQTSSLYFGSGPNSFPIPVPSDKNYFTTTNKSWGMGNIFYASTPISNTPWILVLIKDGPVHKKEWLTFQLSLLFIFVACAISSFFIIRQLVDLLTIRIRESDTKRMALLNEVGHTNRLASIGKLAAGVAHEINNPLAVIDQKAGLIEDILEFTEDFSHKNKLLTSIEGIHTSVERCKIITHRLLGFARKMESEEELVNINRIVEEVMGFLEKEALYSHIIFERHLCEEMPEILSDKGQLQQIFLNIISNAIDAIGQNGKICITSSITKKNMILVEINDNGPGIKPEVMEHIFDPFFTTKETGKGTGLGLSITYGLVNKLGGDIKVYSKVGEGVTFYIYLPISA